MDILELKNLKPFLIALQLDEISTEEELLTAVQEMAKANGELRGQLDKLKTEAETGRQYLKDLREETLRLAILLAGENGILDSQKDLIEKADLKTLQYLKEDYAVRVEKQFPAICQSCGSSKISRRSSQEEPPETPEGREETINEEDFIT